MYKARRYPKTPGIKFTKPSKTIPGQTLSVDQMLQRYASGIPLINNGLQYPEYEDDQQIIIKDLTDIDSIKSTFNEVKDRISKAKKPNPGIGEVEKLDQ